MDTKTTAIIAVIAVAVICVAGFVLMSQGGKEPDPVDPDPTFPDLNDKVLVVYFSATETTAGVAETITDYLGADSYRIVPEDPYTAEDLQRDTPGSRVNNENDDPDCRPAIAGEKIDISSYSTIMIGFPIWYHKEPKIIDTFLDLYDMSGKNIVPFCTSWAAGIAGAYGNIATAEPDANVIYGTDFQSDVTDEEIYEWLNTVGLKQKQ